MISRRCSGCLIQQIRIGKHSMKSIDFELLQPVTYGHVTGYISFISEEYITICFKDIHCPRVQTHGGVVIMLTLLSTLIFGMKYAVVWMKQKKKGTARQQAIFYNLDDAALWEQHINKTQHCRTDIIPIYGES